MFKNFLIRPLQSPIFVFNFIINSSFSFLFVYIFNELSKIFLSKNYFQKSICKSFIILIVLFLSQNAFALSVKDNYPNIEGTALLEFRGDSAFSSDKSSIAKNNGTINVDSNFSINFNQNWSLMSNIKVRSLENQDTNNPERYRTILSDKRNISFSDEGLFVEELKGQFKNEDAKFFFGKFDPIFGTAFRKEKRIGIFFTDFTKDYQLREKIGAGFSALFEKSQISANLFMNDNSALNESGFYNRRKASSADGLAGNTSSPSSYSIAIEGKDLLGIDNLFYNSGYRNLSVDKVMGFDNANETGFVGGLEYLIPINSKTSIIPFVELVSLNNFSGINNRDAKYLTSAFVIRYRNWSFNTSNVVRQIKQKNPFQDNKLDRQFEYGFSYKFTNNIVVNLSKANIKESPHNGSLVGLMVSRLYQF